MTITVIAKEPTVGTTGQDMSPIDTAAIATLMAGSQDIIAALITMKPGITPLIATNIIAITALPGTIMAHIHAFIGGNTLFGQRLPITLLTGTIHQSIISFHPQGILTPR